MGYDARGSGIVSNVDCSDRALDRLEHRVARVRGETGRKVALIGHSRGGHFAKALSHRHPDWISASISMGAGLDEPFDVSVPLKGVLKVARGVFARTSDRVERNGCFTEHCRCKFTADFTAPVPDEVPFTAIYSKGDGVVLVGGVPRRLGHQHRGHRQPRRPGLQPQGLRRGGGDPGARHGHQP